MEDCNCENKELRKSVLSNGSVQYRMQCLRCGRVGNAIATAKLTDDEKNGAPPVDRELRDRVWQERRESYNVESQEKSRKWWEAYEAYLRSPEWQAKRRRVLDRDKGWCQSCMERPATQVHHANGYRHLFNEPLFELQSVCDECHKRITEMDRGRYEILPALPTAY